MGEEDREATETDVCVCVRERESRKNECGEREVRRRCDREIFRHMYAFFVFSLYQSLILAFSHKDLLSGECSARSACTYVQSDLALHSPLLYYFLSTEPHRKPYKQLKLVYKIVSNLKFGKISVQSKPGIQDL